MLHINIFPRFILPDVTKFSASSWWRVDLLTPVEDNSQEKPFLPQISPGGDLLHDIRGATNDYIISELERRKTDLRTQLVWIGAQKEPGITARTWKWVNGKASTRQKCAVIFK